MSGDAQQTQRLGSSNTSVARSPLRHLPSRANRAVHQGGDKREGVLREVRDDVSGGDSLADAMTKHPEAFPELHGSMVRAGEKGGFLEDVLARLSEFVSRQDALKNKFIGATSFLHS